MRSTSARMALLSALLATPVSLFGCDNPPPESASLSTEARNLATPSANTSLSPEALNMQIASSRKNAITEAVAKGSPAVVGINVIEVQQFAAPYVDLFDLFSGRRSVYEREVKGLGSGFIISDDGYILTNNHVAGNARKITVTMMNGDKYNAELIGADATSDVALLKIVNSENKRFPYLRLGNSDDILIGEWTIAMGNPFGLFDVNAKPTVTVGVVSNQGMNFFQQGKVFRNMIQTDASISSGNSGGPLLNAAGEVIGMNTMIFSTAQSNSGAGSIGIGFAIPINRVKKIVEILKRDKRVDREFFTGMTIRQVDDEIIRYLGLSPQTRGAVITEIYRNSPAARAGLEPGDVIVSVDGQRTLREDDVLVIINDGITGQTISLTVQRGDETLQKSITLEPRRR